MSLGRIFFPGNPWPEGHPIRSFKWTVERRRAEVWCHVRLRSDYYNAERDVADEDPATPDWASSLAWCNYNRCDLSSANAGFLLCAVDRYTVEGMDGLTLQLAPLPVATLDDLSFQIYLLGHDAVADHSLHFTRVPDTMRFNIRWTGKVARTYVGEEDFRYAFSAHIEEVELPLLPATAAV